MAWSDITNSGLPLNISVITSADYDNIMQQFCHLSGV